MAWLPIRPVPGRPDRQRASHR